MSVSRPKFPTKGIFKRLKPILEWLCLHAYKPADDTILVMQDPGGGTIAANIPVLVPFQVFTAVDGSGAKGVTVRSGYLIDRAQANNVEITNLGEFVALSGDGYVWLDIETDADEALQATIAAGTSLPNSGARMKFTSDPNSYTGSGAPPTQTNAYIILARIVTVAGKSTKYQLVTTHLEMQQVSYVGLPALYPEAGYATYDV